MLDIDQNVFSRSDLIIEQDINSPDINELKNNINEDINQSLDYYKNLKKIILNNFSYQNSWNNINQKIKSIINEN